MLLARAPELVASYPRHSPPQFPIPSPHRLRWHPKSSHFASAPLLCRPHDASSLLAIQPRAPSLRCLLLALLAEFPASIQREYDIRNSAVASPKREILIRLIGQRCSALCLCCTPYDWNVIYTWLSQLDLLPAPGTKAIGCDILRDLNNRRPLGSR